MAYVKTLRGLILVGPLRDNPEPDPQAVLHLYNQQFIIQMPN